MNRPTFTQPIDLWEPDGSLRDVYIQNATPADWVALLALAVDYRSKYLFEGQERPLPHVDAIFQDRSGTHLLVVLVGKVEINCHFFIPTEIELDIDPRQMQEPDDHSEVLTFLERLSAQTTKNLLLTAENSPESPYLSYEPEAMRWQIHELPYNANNA